MHKWYFLPLYKKKEIGIIATLALNIFSFYYYYLCVVIVVVAGFFSFFVSRKLGNFLPLFELLLNTIATSMFRSVQPNRYTIVQRMYSFEFVYLLCYTSKIHNNHNKSTVLHACLDRVH